MDIIEPFIISTILHLCRFKQQRKGQYCVNKYAYEGGNTWDLVDNEEGDRKTEDVKMEMEAEQLQDTAEEEVDDDDFQDSTIIGENCSLHEYKCVVVPAMEFITIDKFPEYVQDLMQNKKKMKGEFKVGYYVCTCVCVCGGGGI